MRDGEFEYEYSLRGDGTVPMDLARLDGARHRYVNCGHSDMPLSERVIAGTIDLLKSGTTRRFTATPRIRRTLRLRVRDAELRREYLGKVDWPHMSPEERRQFLDTLNEPPRGMQQRGASRRRSKVTRRTAKKKSARRAKRSRRGR
jgi:hypothetical protein